MIQLTDEMRQAIGNAYTDGCPCLVATASREGRPDIGFKGSMMVWDDGSLAWWERSRGVTLTNVQENPNVAVLYRNPSTRLVWRFYGAATIYREGSLREQVMGRVIPPELERDPERKGYAVIVRVDQVFGGATGQLLQTRD